MYVTRHSNTDDSAQAPRGKLPIWSWRHAIAETDVPPLTKLLCYTLSLDLSDAGKFTRVGVAELCRLSGMSERSVTTHAANAETAGLVTIERVRNQAGHVTGTRYYPRFPGHVELSLGLPADFAGRGKTGEKPVSLDASPAGPRRKICGQSIDTFPRTSPIKEGESTASGKTAHGESGALDAQISQAPAAPCGALDGQISSEDNEAARRAECAALLRKAAINVRAFSDPVPPRRRYA
jgi:DNA-binding transcriptional ArsR family regulator